MMQRTRRGSIRRAESAGVRRGRTGRGRQCCQTEGPFLYQSKTLRGLEFGDRKCFLVYHLTKSAIGRKLGGMTAAAYASLSNPCRLGGIDLPKVRRLAMSDQPEVSTPSLVRDDRDHELAALVVLISTKALPLDRLALEAEAAGSA